MPRRTLVQLHANSVLKSKEGKGRRAGTTGTVQGAVGRHLLSDVPVGILLSGGLDSGLLLALMNEQGGSWPAYTIGYGESFRRRRTSRRSRDGGAFWRAAHNREARSERIRTVSSRYRGMSGGTDCSFLHRADVFRLLNARARMSKSP